MSYQKKFEGTSKEKFLYHNSLLCLVKAIQGHKTVIDLRNDSYLCGLVTSVDGYMNVSMTNAVFCDPQGNEYSFESIFVQARNIRYVHVPENMPIISTIKSELSSTRRLPPKKPTEQSRKVKKALKLHMETVAML